MLEQQGIDSVAVPERRRLSVQDMQSEPVQGECMQSEQGLEELGPVDTHCALHGHTRSVRADKHYVRHCTLLRVHTHCDRPVRPSHGTDHCGLSLHGHCGPSRPSHRRYRDVAAHRRNRRDIAATAHRAKWVSDPHSHRRQERVE